MSAHGATASDVRARKPRVARLPCIALAVTTHALLCCGALVVDTDSDVRLARRLKRDITDRGRDIHGVLQQYENHVKPAYDRFIATTMTYADIIVPRGGENQVGLLIEKNMRINIVKP